MKRAEDHDKVHSMPRHGLGPGRGRPWQQAHVRGSKPQESKPKPRSRSFVPLTSLPTS